MKFFVDIYFYLSWYSLRSGNAKSYGNSTLNILGDGQAVSKAADPFDITLHYNSYIAVNRKYL